MQTIVYTAPHEIDNEIDIISELFEIEGLFVYQKTRVR